MADNRFFTTNEDILVEFDYQNITVIDPNKIRINNRTQERLVNHENLVMYANLEAKMLPRTKLLVGESLSSDVQNVQIASINFLRPGGAERPFLRNDWTDELTGLGTTKGKGTNQRGKSASVNDRTKEYYIKQNTLNNFDTGLLGIESIVVNTNRSNTPSVDIKLIDIQGRALFEKGDQSPYSAFFNLPYPTFYLTLKGYYGKAIRYQLILTKFSARFDGSSGNYEVDLKFYSYKYTILAETSIGSLFALPHMYSSKVQFSKRQPQNQTTTAAQASTGQENVVIKNVKVEKGYQKISEVYSAYKAKGLIAKDFPELTLNQMLIRLEALEKNLIQSFGQQDFTPLSNVDTYQTLLIEYQSDVYSTETTSWFKKYMDEKNFFILKQDRGSLVVYRFKKDVDQTKAIGELEGIITKYNNDLAKIPNIGADPGTVTIGGKTIDTKIENTIDITDLRITVSPNDIDNEETFKKRENQSEASGTKYDEFLATVNDITAIRFTNEDGVIVLQDNFFVFEGKSVSSPTFTQLMDKMFSDLTNRRQEIELLLTQALQKKLEGPNGLGFKPTIRNIFAVILASVEAFYRLMDDVHKAAYEKRNHPTRLSAIIPPDKTSISTDSKDYIQKLGRSGTDIGVYPWPQYFVETNADGEERFELRYPGDPNEIARTRAYEYDIWPEVEFVEEYMKALTERVKQDDGPNGDTDESVKIKRISINSVEYPINNIPFTDKEEVKFFYEIYERILLSATMERLIKPNATELSVYKTVSDLEVINLQRALNESNPFLIKKLKEYSYINYVEFMQFISNQGLGPSWQNFIRGIYNSEYLRGYVDKDFSILRPEQYSILGPTTDESSQSLENVTNYIKSTKSTEIDLGDVAPFTSDSWSSSNLSNGLNNSEFTVRYNTINSLEFNNDKKVIANYTPKYTQTTNRPFTDFDFLSVEQPQPTTFAAFYSIRDVDSRLLPTEGLLTYGNYGGNVGRNQTISMMNTPYFVNAIQYGVAQSKIDGVVYPYKEAAYLFLNSLPLATLREKYKTDNAGNVDDLDYIFATLTKVGAIHKLPYAWILKYGSIWHRYKTYVETGVDMLDSVWVGTPYVDNYDPQTNNPSKNYNLTINGTPTTIVLQQDVVSGGATRSSYNVGFYPKVLNDFFYFINGQELFSDYNDSTIQTQIDGDLNLERIDGSSFTYQKGFDTNNLNRTLSFDTWYVSYDVKNSTRFIPSQRNKTIVFPSFGATINQVDSECFKTGTITTEITNNQAVYDGSVRSFWAAPVYGYYDTTSVAKPPVDSYVKSVDNTTNTQSPFEIFDDINDYTKFDDIFGTFKKQILDEFELEFLNFSKGYKDIDIQDSKDVRTTSFQYLMSDLLLVKQVKNAINADDYVAKLSNNQMANIGNVINTFLNYDIVFKFGNPANYDRRVFGTFEINTVQDPIPYGPYVVNTLPSNGGTTTLAASKLANPNAWKAMETYVGFSTIPELSYSNNGSYYTDFFIDNNVEFTESTVQNFYQLIKIYGTQKLKNNGDYTKTTFVDDLEVNVNTQTAYISNVLTQTLFKIKQELPTVDISRDKPLLTSVDGIQPKIQLWEMFKAFNDKWIAGNDYTEKTLFEDFLFLDRANRDIGDKVYVDIFKLKEFMNNDSVLSARVIDFVSKIIVDNKFFMMPMPAYVNFWGINDIQPNQEPVTEGTLELAKDLFGTHLSVDYRKSSPKFVCYYAGKPSEHLDLRENTDYRFRSDAFDLSRLADNPFIEKLIDKKNWSQTNKVIGFNVDAGVRNQGMFYSIQLDQNSFASTTEANQVVYNMGSAAGGRKSNTQSVGLYNLYQNRSYECTVESLGNAMIQPTMYFNLRHVPMFNGPYMIQDVTHTISSGEFKTSFTGVRMPIYSLPKLENQIMTINQNILSELVSNIRQRRQQNQTNNQTPKNVITAGNTIRTNQGYSSQFPSVCFSDIGGSQYSTYDGVEAVETKINYQDLMNKIKTIPDRRVRGCVLYTIFLNGHTDTEFVSFNYNIGGVPLGGLDYETVKYGGNLSTLFTNQYVCLQDASNISRPYAVFSDFDKGIQFISARFNGKVNESDLKWGDKENFISSTTITWLRYWPVQRWQTSEQQANWVKSNESTLSLLINKASEVYNILEKYKLI